MEIFHHVIDIVSSLNRHGADSCHFFMLSYADDCNRVVLQSSQDGDYINASYISLPLPGVNNTLQYIAAQGDCVKHFE